MPCAIDDHVELRDAVTHPSLDRPVVFAGGIEVAPLLRIAVGSADLGHLLDRWAGVIPSHKAVNLVRWLFGNGILGIRVVD